jgi:Protein of unknown function (DUF3606)
MADDKSEAGKPDRDPINVDEDYEPRSWSKRLGIMPEQLTAAVAAVGPMAEDVRRHLKIKA